MSALTRKLLAALLALACSNADNETLLDYLKANRLTTAQAFDTFAAHRDADDPRNVLGIAYGHLAEYDGYHSHDETGKGQTALPMAA